MSIESALPDWLHHVAGEAPLLLVAPHGGRRPAASELEPAASRKVNDLHTAELTLELAARLGAGAIVNRGVDRNTIDLNRVSHVRKSAPWLLDLLLRSVREQLGRTDCATLLFVHGWNAIQPSCDLGIGARLGPDGFLAVKQGVPTIPWRRLPRLVRFADACRRGGIDVTVGDRYPAANRENVLQLFTRRFADDADPRIRELAALGGAGQIFAVQIELAVPLRWPGPLRRRALDAVRELAVDPAEEATSPEALHVPRAEAAPLDQLAVEFHDGDSGIGGFAASERTASGRRHGRLLVCIGTRRLLLFTGEDGSARPDSLCCMGLEWHRGDGEVSLRFAGPCLAFPRTDPFLDLEAGLFDAKLYDVALDLVWRSIAQPLGKAAAPLRLGRIQGTITYDGASASLSAAAALQDGWPHGEGRPWQQRRTLRVPLGADTYASISTRTERSRGDEAVEGHILHRGQVEPILSGRVSVHNSADGLAPEAWRIEAVSRSTTLRVFGHVTHAIPVVRPAPDGKVLTIFGLARFTEGDRVGYGTFEQSEKRKGRTP